MDEYVVHKTWRVSAESREAAALIADVTDPDMTRVSVGLPPERFGYRQWYTQPIHVLDVAWDVFHEADILVELGQAPEGTPRIPSFTQLAIGGVQPAHISMLFDMAITAYIERLDRL